MQAGISDGKVERRVMSAMVDGVRRVPEVPKEIIVSAMILEGMYRRVFSFSLAGVDHQDR
jgi:hypothetical protein